MPVRTRIISFMNTTPRPEYVALKSAAAVRRAQLADRAELIAALGWAPEGRADVGDNYLASSVELLRWLNEKRVAAGEGPRAERIFMTETMHRRNILGIA